MPDTSIRRAGMMVAALLGLIVACGLGGGLYLEATRQAVKVRSIRDDKLNALRCDYWRPSMRSGEEIRAYAFGTETCRLLVPVHSR